MCLTKKSQIKKQMEGKIIESVCSDTVNCWKITFTDGTEIWLQADVGIPVSGFPYLYLTLPQE